MTLPDPPVADVGLAELTADPHRVWPELRKLAPVVRVPVLDGSVVLGYPEASAVLRDSSAFTVDDPRFSTGQLFGPSMLSTDGPTHDRFRAAFAEPFRPGLVRQEFSRFVGDQVRRLFDGVGSPFEVRTAVAGPLAVSVMARLLGLANEDPAVVLSWYSALVGGVNRISAGAEAGPEALAAHAELARSLSASGSLAGTGDLSTDEAVANAGILLFGGIETTEGMIASLIWHVLSSPAVSTRLRAEPDLVDVAVEESLRLEPAATRVDRYASREVELGGLRIGRGELVIVSLAAANRDPAVFAEPDRFDLSRSNAHRNLALAAGPHYCLGAHLARLQARTVLAELLERWPSASLVAAESDAPRGLVFRKPARVTVQL